MDDIQKAILAMAREFVDDTEGFAARFDDDTVRRVDFGEEARGIVMPAVFTPETTSTVMVSWITTLDLRSGTWWSADKRSSISVNSESMSGGEVTDMLGALVVEFLARRSA